MRVNDRSTTRNRLTVAVLLLSLFVNLSGTARHNIAFAATPTPEVPFQDKLPRDEKGRIIGGLFPVINYSATMITGKPCTRVTTWDFDLVKMNAPLMDYGISKDPCVVQNAVDDLVRTLYFNPAFNTPESMKDVASVYNTDPMNVDGVEKTLRQSMIDLFDQGQQNYNRCNKPVYRLLDVDARAPLIANNDGHVSGQAIQIMILRVANNVAPFLCEFVSYTDGTVKGRFSVTEADLVKPFGVRVNVFNLLWNPTTQKWVVYTMDALPVLLDYYTTARALWGMSPLNISSISPDVSCEEMMTRFMARRSYGRYRLMC